MLAFWGRSPSSNNVLTILGSATALGGSFGPSDRTLKRNIAPTHNALEIVSQLKGYTYEYRTDERPELNLPKGRRYGFITQEVQAVMPSIVRQADDINGKPADFQVMEYDAIVPVLAEAISLQQEEIQTQKNVITKLEEQNSLLEARLEVLVLGEKARSEQTELPNASGIELGQNRPNPTDGNTAIKYTLPKDMINAIWVVYDLNGREISSQIINDQSGIIELNTNAWAPGAYVYSIVLDGRALARKKMLVK